jgi:Tfp pilus assembly protein PilF
VLWLVLALVLVTLNLIVFAPVRDYGYVDFDDRLYVAENPNVARGLTWDSMHWAFTTARGGFWMPLTWLSYMLDVDLYGPSPGPQHVTNVLLHILSTLVLFAFLVRTTAAVWKSALVAALFAIHPLHVESVVWIAERKDVLSGLFWMLTLWAYAAYVLRPVLRRYLVIVLTFTLALMAKPMVVTLPFVLLLLDIWPLRRIRLEAGQRDVWLRAVVEKLPLFALSGLFAFLTFVLHANRGGISELDTSPLGPRIANALYSYAAYFGSMLWPTNLAPIYPFGALPALLVVGSVLLLVAVSMLVIRRAFTHPFLLVGWLWYLGTLVPVIGLVQVGAHSRADRFTYIPLIGLFVVVCWGIPELAARMRRRETALLAAAAVVTGTLVIAARTQVHYWESRLTLWEHTLKVTDANYVAHGLLALALADHGRTTEAIDHYRLSLSIRPDFAQAHNNLGITLAKQGRLEEAAASFRTAVSLGTRDAEMHYNLGFALAAQGHFDEAIVHYEEALRLRPAYAEAHTKIGDALQTQGMLDAAISKYNEALRIRPDFALAHTNLGMALSAQERYEEAIFHYVTAVRIQPDLAEAHNGLGTVLASQGKYDEAIAQFTDALRIQPGLVNARDNLAVALAARAGNLD